MVEFGDYQSELIDFVRRSGRVSADVLVRWAKEKGLTTFTLYVLLEEAIEAGELKGSSDKYVIDEIFNLEIPSTVEPARPAPQPLFQPPTQRRTQSASHAEKRDKGRERRRTRVERGGLLKFFAGEQEPAEQKSPQEFSAEPLRTGERFEESHLQPETPEALSEVAAELKELLADEDFVKAIRYLGRYWSVGRLRFIEDLANMGVKDPGRILEGLLAKRLIEVVEPGLDGAGVVNAKEDLLLLAQKVAQPGSTQLSEMFQKKV